MVTAWVDVLWKADLGASAFAIFKLRLRLDRYYVLLDFNHWKKH